MFVLTLQLPIVQAKFLFLHLIFGNMTSVVLEFAICVSVKILNVGI